MLYTYTVRDQIHRCNNRYRAGAPRALDRLSTAVVDDLWITPRYFWNRAPIYAFITTTTLTASGRDPCAPADRQRGNRFAGCAVVDDFVTHTSTPRHTVRPRYQPQDRQTQGV